MIIKSMPYKDPNFRRLQSYIDRKAVEGCVLVRNLPFFEEGHQEDILANFEANTALLPPRANGNLLYHEILSIQPQNDVPLQTHLQALYQLANHYLEKRAPDHPAYGRVHHEEGNVHLHLMITANALASPQRHRLSKARYGLIQKDCERWFGANFPELPQVSTYREAQEQKISRSEQERNHHQKTPSQKQQLSQTLEKILHQSEREGDFTKHLQEQGIKIYQRGKIVGIISQGKKYRLKTLGVLDFYKNAQKRWQKVSDREKDLQNFFQNLNPSSELELPPIINPPMGWQ